jgi:hypothetical protein
MKGEWLVENTEGRVARAAARHRRPGSVRFDGLHACGFNLVTRPRSESISEGRGNRSRKAG